MSALLGTEFSVTPSANRMGVKLSRGGLHSGIESLLSEATCYGAIQIPPDGAPIVLLNDRQTVGGYPKPGAVISSDCARLAQARPGQKVRLVSCSAEEADRIQWLERHFVETRLQ